MRFDYSLLSAALFTLAACPGQGGSTDTNATTDAATTTDTAASTDPSETTTTGANTSTPTTGDTALTVDEAVPCQGMLPPDGSGPCAVEGEECKFEDDPCTAYTSAVCTNGVWVHYENTPGIDCGGVTCEPPNFPNEGDPCSEEGASCSTDCSDQCQFCNSWMCQGGVWMRLEVFPAPCLECDALCDFVIAPMCPGGPPDKAACVSGCEDNKVGACKAEFSALRGCAGEQPTFTCDMAERPVVAGCEAQFTTFYDCLMP